MGAMKTVTNKNEIDVKISVNKIIIKDDGGKKKCDENIYKENRPIIERCLSENDAKFVQKGIYKIGGTSGFSSPGSKCSKMSKNSDNTNKTMYEDDVTISNSDIEDEESPEVYVDNETGAVFFKPSPKELNDSTKQRNGGLYRCRSDSQVDRDIQEGENCSDRVRRKLLNLDDVIQVRRTDNYEECVAYLSKRSSLASKRSSMPSQRNGQSLPGNSSRLYHRRRWSMRSFRSFSIGFKKFNSCVWGQ